MSLESKKQTYLKEMATIKEAELLRALCTKAINALYAGDFIEARYNLHMVSRGVKYPIETIDNMEHKPNV
jgi:hypothetical protein